MFTEVELPGYQLINPPSPSLAEDSLCFAYAGIGDGARSLAEPPRPAFHRTALNSFLSVSFCSCSELEHAHRRSELEHAGWWT